MLRQSSSDSSVLVGWLCLLLCFAHTALADSPLSSHSPLRPFSSCTTPTGVVGECRAGASQAAVADTAAAAALELPIDMRLPCEDANRTCAENVDTALAPIKAPSGDRVASCSITLMPWSPFPCTFSTDAYKGVEGQNKTSWCYSRHTKPAGPQYENARDLVTDGYSNFFHGSLPNTPCGHVQPSLGGKQQQAVAVGSSYGRHFSKILLTVNFRVAAGRQFDRTYWLQIGRAVAALGTCTEPTRWLGTDKWWTSTIDITHLQAYLSPGLPTRMSMSNLLSNTYNVPLWAEATVQYFWEVDSPPAASRALLGAPEGEVAQPVVPQQQQQRDAAPAAGGAAPAEPSKQAPAAAVDAAGAGGGASRASRGSDAPQPKVRAPTTAKAAAADVPDEVLPLVPSNVGSDSVSVVAGKGDESGDAWPSVTFRLPAELSAAGNIIRAQLLVTPKADSCEEFWAMNPSGQGVNSTCGGYSTGEPYREVRVYVNDQLAGFSPLYYTMYSGGVDPRLWSAIVASYTYSLPSYTFDLSPWLPQLNSLPAASTSRHGSRGPRLSRSRAAASVTASSSSSSSQSTAGSEDDGRSDARMPSMPHQQPAAAMRRLSEQAAGVSSSMEAGSHTITVELGGVTGDRWMVANTLLLWRAVGPDGEPQRVTAVEADEQQPQQQRQKQQQGQQVQQQQDEEEEEEGAVQVVTSPGFEAPLESRCVPLRGGGELSVAGNCTLQVRDRWLRASSQLQWQGRVWTASIAYATSKYDNTVTYSGDANATDAGLSWYQKTHHRASWSVKVPKQQQQQQPPAGGAAGPAATAAATLTESSVQFDWLNSGEVAAGGAFEYSFNTTLLQPTIYAAPAAFSTAGSSSGQVAAAAAGVGGRDVVVGTGRQRHYQRAIMLNVYTPQSPRCEVPANATHTVSLLSSISSSSSSGEGQQQQQEAESSTCVRRWGTCGFCGAWLMDNAVEWDADGC